MSNRNDLDVLHVFTIEDEIGESPDRNSTSATSDSDALDGAPDTWVLADHAEDLLDLTPELVAQADALSLIPLDCSSKLSLGF